MKKKKIKLKLFFGCVILGLMLGIFITDKIISFTGFYNDLFLLFWSFVYGYLIAEKMYNHFTEYKPKKGRL